MSKLVAACLPPAAAAATTAGQQQPLSVSSRGLVASPHALAAAEAQVALQGLLALITGLPGGGQRGGQGGGVYCRGCWHSSRGCQVGEGRGEQCRW